MKQNIPLIGGRFYHIYNCGVNGTNLFLFKGDYERFLILFSTFIEPIAETFAWCLMKNHIHLLVRVRLNIRYKYSIQLKDTDPKKFALCKWETTSADKSSNRIPKPHQHFAHLFSSYAKYFNKRTHRHGSLFEDSFKRKPIDNKYYLKQAILYIHNNPVHHGFCKSAIEYPWSSYLSCISIKPTKLQRDKIIGMFDNKADFIDLHNKSINLDDLIGLEYL